MSVDLSMPILADSNHRPDLLPVIAIPTTSPSTEAGAVPTATAQAIRQTDGGSVLNAKSGHGREDDTAATTAATANEERGEDTLQQENDDLGLATSVLQQQGFPRGLAHEMVEARISFPIRFWIIDNSGSMLTPDGQELRSCGQPQQHQVGGGLRLTMMMSDTDENMTTVPCTRWAELKGSVNYHAELAALLQATTIFRFLNNPGSRVGPQELIIAGNTETALQEDVDIAKSVLAKTTPKGATPLSSHLQEIRLRIEAMKDILETQGQSVVIVLATDGMPTDAYGDSTEEAQQEFITSIKAMQCLPVWIVVRLCTSDQEVVNFYNGMDAMLELPLEVIDHFVGEAREIQGVNPWLNYTMPLHRCREMGYQHRIFDLLDERLLNKDELREFLELLLGHSSLVSFPDIHTNWKGFLTNLTKLLAIEGQHFNPIKKKQMALIDTRQLDRCYRNYTVPLGGGGGRGRTTTSRAGFFRRRKT